MQNEVTFSLTFALTL